MKPEPRIQIVGRLPRSLRQALGAYARKNRISMNRVLEDALRKHLPQPTTKGAER